MSEMSLTADHLIVIGRGRLVADEPIRDLLSRGPSSVKVRTPDADRLGALIVERGGRVQRDAGGSLSVSQLSAVEIGELAAAHGVVLHELTSEQASLEEAFFELTNDTVEFHGDVAAAGSTSP